MSFQLSVFSFVSFQLSAFSFVSCELSAFSFELETGTGRVRNKVGDLFDDDVVLLGTET